MTDKLFYKILEDLKEIDFKGRISFYLMNEPLLDDRLLMFIKDARAMFPTNRLNFSTNAVLLNDHEQYFEAGLTDMDVSCYTKPILDKYWPLRSHRIDVHNFVENHSVFYNRGGLVNYGPGGNNGVVQAFCIRPFNQLYVVAEGKAVLCCSDYKRQAVMGDVNKQSLSEIWNSEKYQKYRSHLKEKRRDLPVCNQCNYV